MAGDPLERIIQAAAEIARTRPRLERATRELHAAILEAYGAGHSRLLIAKAAGLTRGRVDQIIRGAQE